MAGTTTARATRIASRKIQIALYENFLVAQPKAAELGMARIRMMAYSKPNCVKLTTR